MSVECPTVTLATGRVRGNVSRATDPDSKCVFRFLGIPFGKPTTGDLRFANPQKCDPWDGVLETAKLTHDAPQNASLAAIYAQYFPSKNSLGHDHAYQSEDCLKLNLFTPSCNKSEKMAVMLHIVGGGFMRSNALRYDGTALAGMNNVVVVSPNYRPNALGFLSLGKHSKCPGNMSLQDIILALRWVQDNIASFGGDPDNVTIFGESAGGVMSHILMLSNKTEGLFHKAIVMSCTANFQAMVAEDGKQASDRFLENMKIDHKDSDENILKKLRKLNIDEITLSETAHSTNENIGTFNPCIDGDILDETPLSILKQGKIRTVPMLAGVAASELAGILSLRHPPNFQEGMSEEGLRQYLDKVMISFTHTNEEQVNAVVQIILNWYKAKDQLTDADKFRYSKMYNDIGSDLIINIPLTSAALANSVTSPTFLYVMDHALELNHSDVNGPEIKNKLDFVTTDHGDIMHFVFGAPFINGKLNGGAWFTDGDRTISRHTMTYFTNFAKNSDPNKGHETPCKWPAYTNDSKEHIVLKVQPTTDKNFRSEQSELFNQLFGKM